MELLAATGQTVLVALHDRTLAARYCSRLLLLHGGTLVAAGTPEEVLTPDRLREVFGVEAVVGHDGWGNPAVAYRGVAPRDAGDTCEGAKPSPLDGAGGHIGGHSGGHGAEQALASPVAEHAMTPGMALAHGLAWPGVAGGGAVSGARGAAVAAARRAPRAAPVREFPLLPASPDRRPLCVPVDLPALCGELLARSVSRPLLGFLVLDAVIGLIGRHRSGAGEKGGDRDRAPAPQ